MEMNLSHRIKVLSGLVLICSLLLCMFSQPLLCANKKTYQRFAQAAPKAAEAQLKNLKKKGDNLIAVRIKVIDIAIKRISKAKKISDADRNSLLADLQSQKDALNSLKAKIDAETDPEILKGYVNSIFVDYRIFMVVVPRGRGLYAAARLNYTINKLGEVSSQLESLINTFKQEGKDTSEVEGYLNILKTDLTNAQLDVDQAKSIFSSMTPEKDEEAKSMIKSGTESLKAAGVDLKDAASQAKKITSWLKGM